MHPVLRNILMLVVAVIVGAIVIKLVELAAHQFVAMPTNVNFEDPAQLQGYMDLVPTAGKVTIVVGWFLGMLAGAVTAVKLLDHKTWPATFMVLFLLGATATNFVFIPHPLWMAAAAVIAAAIAWFLATRLARRRDSTGNISQEIA